MALKWADTFTVTTCLPPLLVQMGTSPHFSPLFNFKKVSTHTRKRTVLEDGSSIYLRNVENTVPLTQCVTKRLNQCEQWATAKAYLLFFLNLHSGGWNQSPLDTAAT
jgi:hypothetical protein